MSYYNIKISIIINEVRFNYFIFKLINLIIINYKYIRIILFNLIFYEGSKNMINKVLSILIVLVIILSGFSVTVISNNNEDNILIFEEKIEISQPKFENKNNYVIIELDKATSNIMQTGKPILPVITKTFTYEVGTEIIDIEINSEVNEYLISDWIQPAPQPIILSIDNIQQIGTNNIDLNIYKNSKIYPEKQYSIRKGIGLKDDKHVVFVKIDFYVQYLPLENKILTPEQIKIKIKYKESNQQFFSNNLYDMLIITDEKFIDNLQPLIDHKNNIGIKTILDTTQNIYPSYNGRDEAEDIKLRIANAIEELGIKYVLLVGGRKGQTYEWYIPERRSNNDDRSGYETGYSTDLYYADVFSYKPAGLVFEDWDSDGDNIFAEFTSDGIVEDIIDYYPDVYLGRLPVRYSWEVDVVVNKIINYEIFNEKNWFRNALVVSGDTSPPARGDVKNGVYEGEISTKITADMFEDINFNVTKLWTSDGTFSDNSDVQNAINSGYGWVHFAGHASPAVWGNFLPDAQTEEEFVYGVTFLDIAEGGFSNNNKLPIMIIGGCHTCQFNVSMQQLFTGGDFGKSEWIPTDFSSLFLLYENGGSIASIGPTGLGYGYINEYVTEGLGGWLNPRFAQVYTIQNKDYLGEVWGVAITDYINQKGSLIDDVNSDSIDRKTIEETVLLGDPSLKIGGIKTGINDIKEKNNLDLLLNQLILTDADLPDWDIGDSWNYKINNVDFYLSEIENRTINFQLSSGIIKMKIIEETDNLYKMNLNVRNLNVSLYVDFDFYIEEKNPILIDISLHNASLIGNISINKNNLGINNIDAKLFVELNSSDLPFDLPKLFTRFVSKIPIEINLVINFNNSFIIIDFPLNETKEWELKSNNITIDGEIKSIWLNILNILNKIYNRFGRQFISPEFAQFLPVIDISEYLSFYNISNSIQIPDVDEFFRKTPYMCEGTSFITTQAGSFESFKIDIMSGIGTLYYSPEIENIVKLTGHLDNFIPYLNNVDMELMSVSN
jgi:hypothetical protein